MAVAAAARPVRLRRILAKVAMAIFDSEVGLKAAPRSHCSQLAKLHPSSFIKFQAAKLTRSATSSTLKVEADQPLLIAELPALATV